MERWTGDCITGFLDQASERNLCALPEGQQAILREHRPYDRRWTTGRNRHQSSSARILARLCGEIRLRPGVEQRPGAGSSVCEKRPKIA